MKLTQLVAIAIFSSTLGATAAMAQTSPGSEPAEFPPASFLGKQYVDSQGCVFIRAGIDGNVSWVPRVTRSRSGVCGFKPTLAGQVTEAVTPAPVQTAAVDPAAAAPAVSAAPAPRPAPVVRRAAPAPKPAPKVVRQVAKPAPPVVQAAAPLQQGAAACAGASAISSQYLRAGDLPVRCGPQAAPIVGGAQPTAPRGLFAGVRKQPQEPTIQVSPNCRIVPRHVAVNRVNTTDVQVPAGYKKVWNDGRLNPKRAEQSLAGHKAMGLVWTSTVPRRLINQATGADVTASEPLVYPYTDYAAQQRELGQVTIVERDGQILKRLVRNVQGIFAPQQRQARGATVARQPVYSSRSAPQRAAPKAAAQRAQPKAAEVAGRGYVQVGAFTDTAAAHRLAKRVQRMGMPVRVGVYTRGGQTTRLVIAGPFGGDSGVSRAVSKLRGAGYKAFAR
jgi:hypothetical protein